jgi:hypothetical protein
VRARGEPEEEETARCPLQQHSCCIEFDHL